ncbi:MAG: hypothetical protein WCY29_04170 [Novosphingobium sp.]
MSENLPYAAGHEDIGDDESTVERLKAELKRAFAAPDSSFQSIDAQMIIKRNAQIIRSDSPAVRKRSNSDDALSRIHDPSP